MSKANTLKNVMTGVAGTALVAGLAISPAHAEWTPRKPVELIIPAGAGGGADQIARLLQSLIQRKDLSPRPFIPVNKSGGSGAEALTYMARNADKDHTVMVTLNSFYTTPIIQQGLGVDIMEFTPIGLMALDNFLLWLPADSEVETLDDYVEAVNSNNRWRMGGTGSGQEDSILTAMIENELDIDMTYVPFDGGGTVAKNLVGKHIDSTVNNPAEQNEFWRAGMSKPIVQFTDERHELYPDVPTAKEEGYDLVYYMQRSVNGPPGMSSEAQEFYMNVFQELFESEEWKNYCESEGLDCAEWIAGEDLAEFHETAYQRHVNLIEKVGATAITGE